VTRRIRFNGADDSFLYFSTPSWTRGSKIVHEIHVDKRTGKINCGCEDGSWRHKQGDILNRESKEPCKHVQRLCSSFERIIRESLEVAVAA
jgi:hypothetical protein